MIKWSLPSIIRALAITGIMVVVCTRPVPAQQNQSAATDTSTIQVIHASASQILDVVKNSDGQAIMMNVWATWCTPCREEFPDMMKLYQYYHPQGLKLILVSGDFPDKMTQVKQFLAEQGVTFKTYIKTGKDMEFINTLNPDWSGALPATWIFNKQGQLHEFWQGKADFEKMEKSVLEVLNENQTGG